MSRLGMMEDILLLQRWQQFSDRLEFEIGKAEHQLTGVNARLADLRRDLWIYILFGAVPFLVAAYFWYLQEDVICVWLLRANNGLQFSFLQLLYTVATIARYVSFSLAIVSLPVSIFYVARSVKRYLHHNRTIQWELPRERLMLHEGRNRKEYNCYAERESLVWVLNKYYMYRSRLQAIKKKILEHPPQITEEQLDECLAELVFYEEIRPASIKKG